MNIECRNFKEVKSLEILIITQRKLHALQIALNTFFSHTRNQLKKHCFMQWQINASANNGYNMCYLLIVLLFFSCPTSSKGAKELSI